MNELELAYAEIGRNKLALDKLNAAYGNLLNVLASVVEGEIERSRVLVNLTDRTWLFVGPGESPALPPQINGLPVVVVAPPLDAGTA